MNTVSGKSISKIGIGSYGIGGRGHRDMDITEKENDDKYVDAIIYTLEKGSNFTEISLGYGHGQSLKLFSEALAKSSVNREDLFLTHSLYPRDLQSMKVIEKDTADFYKIMNTDYADSTLVTQGLIMQFREDETYDFLEKLLNSGKSRYVSLSNASPTWIKKFKQRFGDRFFAHEGHLSFEIRALQDKGVFETCKKLGIENIIWRPFRRNKTFSRNWPVLIELAEKYNKTQGQIILNWMCSNGFRPMVFSTNKLHIDENLDSTSFEMTTDDYELLNEFRPPNYHSPKVDWEGMDGGDQVVALAADFDLQIDSDENNRTELD